MPELPETETIARDLARLLTGAAVVKVVVRRPDVLRISSKNTLKGLVTGAVIVRCWRRAKAVILDLDSGDRVVVVPRFTGALRLVEGNLPEDERAYSAVAFVLSDGRTLHYRDVRRLGTVALMSPEQFLEFDRRLGPEPLDPDFTAAQLSGILRGSGQAVKKVLMDQRRIAGIGNIYANEALWGAEIDPSRPGRSLDAQDAQRLHHALRTVLRASIKARGTTFRDYRDAAGGRGGFASRLAAYGRGGLPCRRCARRLVETHAVDGRTTVFCPGCQR